MRGRNLEIVQLADDLGRAQGVENEDIAARCDHNGGVTLADI